MTNFQTQMNEAIATYSDLSGETFSAVVAKLAAEPTGTVAGIIQMLMFTTR